MESRRNLIKQAGCAILATPFVSIFPENLDNRLWTPKEIFEETFSTQYFQEGFLAEYPLSILAPDDYANKTTKSIVKNKKSETEIRKDGDYIVVPTYKQSSEELYNNALDLIICTAIDRNIVVYDSDSDGDKVLTNRLVAIAKLVFKRNSSLGQHKLDAIIVDKNTKIEGVEDYELDKDIAYRGVKIFRTDMSRMRDIAKKMNVKLPSSCSDFVIGVSTDQRCPTMVNPKVGEEDGLAILSNKSVILGAI